eukprot:1537722-Rhodomonas_salina.2
MVDVVGISVFCGVVQMDILDRAPGAKAARKTYTNLEAYDVGVVAVQLFEYPFPPHAVRATAAHVSSEEAR